MEEGNIFATCVFFAFSPSRQIIKYLCCVARCSLVEEMVSESFVCDVLAKLNQGMRYLSIYLSVYLSICLSVRPSVCPSVRPPARPPVRLSVSQMSQPAPNWSTIGPPAKRHSDGVSGPILRAYWSPAYKVCVKDGRMDKPP